MSPPRLTIGYSTLGERVRNIEFPPPQQSTEILVVVQGYFAAVPTSVKARNDIRVIRLTSTGVARSRNAVISAANGTYLAFADDDARPLIRGVTEALDYLDANANVCVLAGRTLDFAGRPRKRYARREKALTRWNSGKFGTVEIVVRTASLIANNLRFDEQFGAGTPNYLGDEYIFLTDAIRLGLLGVFKPIDLAEHSAESSGTEFGTEKDASARSAVLGRVFGRAAFFARFAFILRHPRRFGGIWKSCRFVAGYPSH